MRAVASAVQPNPNLCVAECAAECVAECAAECVAQELEKRAAELKSMKEAAKASGEHIKQLKAQIASANNGDKEFQALQVHGQIVA